MHDDRRDLTVPILKAQKIKRLTHPFVLDEENLRKLNEVLSTRMAGKPGEHVRSFRMFFDDGLFYETATIEQLLSEENPSHRMITDLEIHCGNRYDYFIGIHFNSSDRDKPTILYTVQGEQRDWVYVTASDIDDRISKAKAPGALLYKPFSISLLATITMFLLFLAMGYGLWTRGVPSPNASLHAQTLEEKIDALANAVASADKERVIGDRKMFSALMVTLVVFLVIAIFGGFLLLPLRRLYPVGTFAIGDQAKTHENRLVIRQNILWAVFVAFAIAILAGILLERWPKH